MSELEQGKKYVEYKLKNNEKVFRHYFSTKQIENLKQINMIEFFRIL